MPIMHHSRWVSLRDLANTSLSNLREYIKQIEYPEKLCRQKFIHDYKEDRSDQWCLHLQSDQNYSKSSFIIGKVTVKISLLRSKDAFPALCLTATGKYVNNFNLADSALILSRVTSKSKSRIVEPGKWIFTTCNRMIKFYQDLNLYSSNLYNNNYRESK